MEPLREGKGSRLEEAPPPSAASATWWFVRAQYRSITLVVPIENNSGEMKEGIISWMQQLRSQSDLFVLALD